MDDRLKLRRRQVLQALGLGLGAYSAPVFAGFSVARASGNSGGGSGGGSSGSAPSGGSSSGGQSAPSGPSRPERSAPSRAERQAAPPPELVILSPQPIDADLAAAGYRVIQQQSIGQARLYRLLPGSGRTLAQARADLTTRFPGALSDANSLYRPDEFLCEDNNCASHAAISWPQSASMAELRIGMIDTGINTDHAALQGQNLRVFQSDIGSRSAAGRQHGTAVAALLIGRADSRTPGLLPRAELIAVEAFHRDRRGEAADAFSLTHAMSLLLAEGVKVINLSFSGPENSVLYEAIRQAGAAGVAVVAAAGNGGPGAPAAYPAAWPEVIAVTAVDRQDRPYRQANRGDYIRFAAPGVNVWTAASVSGGRLKSGTSYAAPFVTAALAMRMAEQPHIPLAQHLTTLDGCARDLGDEGADPIFGVGFISLNNQCIEG